MVGPTSSMRSCVSLNTSAVQPKISTELAGVSIERITAMAPTPSSTGMWLSIKTKSNSCFVTCSTACCPFSTQTHTKPFDRKKVSIIMVLVRLSSTISARNPWQSSLCVLVDSKTPASHGLSSSSTTNLVPMHSWLCTVMPPPMCSEICFTIASPKPVPPKRRVVEDSACSNGLKIRFCASGLMPIPVSFTLMVSLVLSLCTCSANSTSTKPRSVNFTALLSKLNNTWRKRALSLLYQRPSGTFEIMRNCRPFSAHIRCDKHC